jgi:hypothetical protein
VESSDPAKARSYFAAPQSPGIGRIEVIRSVRIAGADVGAVAVELEASFWNVPRISTRWFSSPLSVSA